MSIHPAHQQFTMLATRASIEVEAERLASLLAETERELSRLLAVLDWMDGDNDNEPVLGATIFGPSWAGGYDQTAWGRSGSDDRENDADYEAEPDDEGDADGEPSLAAPERHPSPYGRGRDYTCSQIPWAAGGDSDREAGIQ